MAFRIALPEESQILREAALQVEKQGLAEIEFVHQPHDLLNVAVKGEIHLVLVEAHWLGNEALPLLRRLNRVAPLVDIIAMGASVAEKKVVVDYQLDQGASVNDVAAAIRNAIEIRLLLDRAGLCGHSDNLRDAARRIIEVAPTDISVLITGPSGSGKELVAKAVHANSRRIKQQFVSINCASIPESLLESELFGHEKGAFTGAETKRAGLIREADKGTLFLDEIGEMHPRLQAKLLRAIDTRSFIPVGGQKPVEVDVRFLAATNRDLQREVDAGNFRADLYYRLGVIAIRMKRLSERPEDILPIIAHYLGEQGVAVEFTPDATDLLLRYGWPGNVRELTNFLQRLIVTIKEGEVNRDTVSQLLDQEGVADKSLPVVTGIRSEESGYRLIYQALLNLANEIVDMKRILTERLGEPLDKAGNHRLSSPPVRSDSGDLESMEENMIRETLYRVGGNRKKAAEMLGIGERTLYRKLKKYGIS